MSGKFLPLLLASLLPFFLFGQAPSSVEYKRAVSGLSSNKTSVVRFTVPAGSPGHNVSAFPTPFASAEFINGVNAAALSGKAIEKVQLVYTTFAVSPSFDQKGLNGRRLTNLYKAFPKAFENPLTEWELVAQTGATNPEEGRGYFHGFVITWRPDASPELIRREMLLLDSLFSGIKISGKPVDGSTTVGGSSTTGGGTSSGGSTSGGSTGGSPDRELTYPDGKKVLLSRDIPEDSLWRYIKPSSENYSVITARWGDTAHTVVIVTEKTELGYKIKRTWKLDEHKGEPTLGGSGSFTKLALSTPDTVVTSVLRRNAWQNMVMITDVTGSMSPYTAQLFTWMPSALSTGKCAGFVFFNDGDNKKNSNKPIGKTGGIYSTQSQQFDTVFATAMSAMKNGDGGDAVENDLEAVIFALNMLSPQGDIVLVADNWGAPRDLELFAKINRPIHIIICGARGGVNPDYLFLARQTGGTVHTGADDITNLSTMKEGETVKVGFQTFLLHNDHFIPLENFNHLGL